MNKSLSDRTIARLTQYYTILREHTKKDIENITSSQISQILGIDETQVRKDLKSINCSGKCKVGYSVKELKDNIEVILDCKTIKRAFVIGAGNLGTALTKYAKFPDFGLEIAALFDTDKSKIGKFIDDKPIYSLKDLKNEIIKSGIKIAILTTPNKVAQSVCDYVTECGIKYIWNFAPSIITASKDVQIWHENLIGSFIQFYATAKLK